MAHSAEHKQPGHKQLASRWEVIPALPPPHQQSAVFLIHIRCFPQLSTALPTLHFSLCTERWPKATHNAANQLPSTAMTTNTELK